MLVSDSLLLSLWMIVGLVDRWFFRVWSICPLIMGMECGGYLRRRAGVRPGKLIRNPFLSAFSNVDNDGEKSAAWAKATCLATVGVSIATLVWCLLNVVELG